MRPIPPFSRSAVLNRITISAAVGAGVVVTDVFALETAAFLAVRFALGGNRVPGHAAEAGGINTGGFGQFGDEQMRLSAKGSFDAVFSGDAA